MTPPVMLTLSFMPRVTSMASARVLPASALALSAGRALVVMAVPRSVACPPAVETVITPALTPAGTVKVMNCWSGLPPSPSTTVRRLKLPTVRASMLMTRSSWVRPVPSSTMVLPAAMVPPTPLSVGTICSAKLVLLPSTVTGPEAWPARARPR
jgi:hypothetical protein